MVFSDTKYTASNHDFRPEQLPMSTVLRDSQLVDKKQPVSNIPTLNTDDLINKMSKGDSNSSFDLADGFNYTNEAKHGTDFDNNYGTDTDFIEYQYNKPYYAKKESIKIVDHDFSHLEAEYLKSQLENEDINNDTNNSDVHRNPSDRQSSPTRKIKPRELNIESDSDSDDEWKEIDTQLNYGDIYNLKGEKIDSFLHSQEQLTKENSTIPVEKQKKKQTSLQKVAHTGANVGKAVARTAGVKIGKDEKAEKLREKYQRAHLISNDNTKQGYTRIDEEEQAKKFGEMDKKFDFLFQNENSNLRKLHKASSNVNNSVDDFSKSTDNFINMDNFDEIFKNEGHDEAELNPSIQMMTTKTMLTDSQKIAYAALVKLIIVQLNTDLINIRGSGSTKILKKLSICHTSFMRWSMNVMNALYKHLDIKNEQEIKMIETLSCHGVETSDLSKSFNSNVVIENHLNDKKTEEDLQMINVNKTELETDRTIEIDIKWTLICDLFLILLEASVYDARSRTLLLQFANAIGISNIEIYQFERRITDSLEIDEAFEIINNNQTWDESDILKEHKKRQKKAKIVKIALATAAGGLVIGLSAGALAPVIGAGLAAGLTTIGISGTGGFLAGAGGTAIIATSGTMAGMRAGKNAMAHRVGSVKTFEFIPLHNNRRVNLVITVSGWMSGTMDDVRLPFSTVDQVMGDLYSLLWEPEMLTSMGQTINILANEILTQSIQQILGSTLLITLMAGLQLPLMLSKLGYLLDNPWNNSLDRAWRSGKVLADTLRRNKLGVRPITLVGFSLGARLIYSCLLSLAKSGDFGIIENVYIFGSPIVIYDDEIAQARSVVSGRFLNGYMKQDWILGYLFRATSGGLRSIAGLSPIDEEKNIVENFNCSDFVKGHMQYREAMPKLLKEVGWEVLEDQFVEIEQPNPEEEERQRKLLGDFEKAQHNKKKKTWYNKIFGRKHREWWEMYEEGVNEDKKRHIDEENKQNDGSGNEEGEISKTHSIDDKNEVFDVDALREEIAHIEMEAKKLEEKNKESFDNKSEGKDEIVEGLSTSKDKLEVTVPQNSTEMKFHLTPNTEKLSKSTSEGIFEPKKLRKRTSLIQLVESKNTEPIKNISEKTPTNNGQLRQFRINSQGTNKPSITKSHHDKKSPNINLNVFQPISQNPQICESHAVEKTDNDEKAIYESKTNDCSNLDDLKNIDYGEYYVPEEEHMQIVFDDDIDAIEEKIKAKQKVNPGFGPVTGIDYSDEEEFPQDESQIQFSFE
jgi:hypothetical protein